MTNQTVTSDFPIADDGISDAAQWLVKHRDECTGALIPELRTRFSLSALGAIEALKLAHTLEYEGAK